MKIWKLSWFSSQRTWCVLLSTTTFRICPTSPKTSVNKNKKRLAKRKPHFHLLQAKKQTRGLVCFQFSQKQGLAFLIFFKCRYSVVELLKPHIEHTSLNVYFCEGSFKISNAFCRRKSFKKVRKFFPTAFLNFLEKYSLE